LPIRRFLRVSDYVAQPAPEASTRLIAPHAQTTCPYASPGKFPAILAVSTVLSQAALGDACFSLVHVSFTFFQLQARRFNEGRRVQGLLRRNSVFSGVRGWFFERMRQRA